MHFAPRALLISAAIAFSSCVTPKSYLRVATATEADFERVKDKDIVWYEFKPNDVVPFNLLYFGAIEGGATSIGVRAKKPFYLVAQKNQPMRLSYDGQSISYHQLRSIIAVVPRKDGSGGEVGWMTYLGEASDPEKELEALFEKSGEQ